MPLTQEEKVLAIQTGVGGRMDELSARNHLECHPAVRPRLRKVVEENGGHIEQFFLIFSGDNSKMLIERNEKWIMLTCKIALFTLMSNIS